MSAKFVKSFCKIALLLFCFLHLGSVCAETTTSLQDLDRYRAKYPSFRALLADPQGLLGYREMIKAYMGYGPEFDAVFDATIAQHRQLDAADETYHQKIWRNIAQGAPVIVVKGSKTRRSGFETDRVASETALHSHIEDYRSQIAPLLEIQDPTARQEELQKLEQQALESLGALQAKYSEEIRNPSKQALKRMTDDIDKRQQRQNYSNEMRQFAASNEAYTKLIAFLRYSALKQESWSDVYRRMFAEENLVALRELDELTGSETRMDSIVQSELGKVLDPALQSLALRTDKLFNQASENWIRLVNTRKYFGQHPTPSQPAELTEEVARIQAENPGIDAHNAQRKLSPTGQERLSIYHSSLSETYRGKQRALAKGHSGNLYRLPVVDEPDQASIEIRKQNSDEMTLIPMHALDASFGGHLTKECVGGAQCAGLTPRRTALSAADGVRTYAAQKGNAFDGVLRIIPVIEQKPPFTGKEEHPPIQAEAVDMMIRSISDTQEIRSEVTGQMAKYPLFDAILDQIPPAADSHGFMAGDGHAISQNTGLAKVYAKSPSVATAQALPEGVRFGLADKSLVSGINQLFPNAEYNYNPGGMIFEGMPGDGQKRFLLRAKKQRPKYSLQELEHQLFEAFVRSPNEVPEHPAWTLAVQNDVQLQPLAHYSVGPQSEAELVSVLRRMLQGTAEDKRDAWGFLHSDRSNELSSDSIRNLISSEILASTVEGQGMDASEMQRVKSMVWSFLDSKKAAAIAPKVLGEFLKGIFAHEEYITDKVFALAFLNEGSRNDLPQIAREGFDPPLLIRTALARGNSAFHGTSVTEAFYFFSHGDCADHFPEDYGNLIEVLPFVAVQSRSVDGMGAAGNNLLREELGRAAEKMDLYTFFLLAPALNSRGKTNALQNILRESESKLLAELKQKPISPRVWHVLVPALDWLFEISRERKEYPINKEIYDALIHRIEAESWPAEMWNQIESFFTKRNFGGSEDVWLWRDLINSQKHLPESFVKTMAHFFQERRNNFIRPDSDTSEWWKDQDIAEAFARLIEERPYELPYDLLDTLGRILPDLDTSGDSLIMAVSNNFKRRAHRRGRYTPQTNSTQFPNSLYKAVAKRYLKHEDGGAKLSVHSMEGLRAFYDAITATQASVPLWFEAQTAAALPRLSSEVRSAALHAFAQVHGQAPYDARQALKAIHASDSPVVQRQAVLSLRKNREDCSRSLRDLNAASLASSSHE